MAFFSLKKRHFCTLSWFMYQESVLFFMYLFLMKTSKLLYLFMRKRCCHIVINKNKQIPVLVFGKRTCERNKNSLPHLKLETWITSDCAAANGETPAGKMHIMSDCWERLINALESEHRYLLHQNYLKEDTEGDSYSLSVGCAPLCWNCGCKWGSQRKGSWTEWELERQSLIVCLEQN